MKLEDLEKMIKKAIREVLTEDKIIKEVLSESITTSINTVFKVIVENKDLFGTKEVIREQIIAAPQNATGPKSKDQIEDDVHKRFRDQMKQKQGPAIQRQAFAGINGPAAAPNPQKVLNETRREPAAPKQPLPNIPKGNYLSMITSAVPDEDDDEFFEDDE